MGDVLEDNGEFMSETDHAYSLEAARNYWKFAPSGLGKVDTEALLALDEAAFIEQWRRHYESRLNSYYEEEQFNAYFTKRFNGKRILSFGSGIGLNEYQFMKNGADVTCADIVATNLRVIERVCRIERIAAYSTLYLEEPALHVFPQKFDYIYAWGSLMTMPFEDQGRVLSNFARCLRPGGEIILMLYTKKFLLKTCGVDSPIEFAKASDPSVGNCHNPWSDWHDDEKVERLADDRLRIAHKQYWNQGYFVTYGLQIKANSKNESSKVFFEFSESAKDPDDILWEVDLAGLLPAEAESIVQNDGSIRVKTGKNPYQYAIVSESKQLAKRNYSRFMSSVDVTLEEGPISVGILDAEKDKFVSSVVISEEGRKTHWFSCTGSAMPARARIVISNHRNPPGESRFLLHRVALFGSVAPGERGAANKL